MKDRLSYSASVDGEENLSGLVEVVRNWIDALPQRANVHITMTAVVADNDEATELSRTPDMFHNGKVNAKGVQTKEKIRNIKQKAKMPGANLAPEAKTESDAE